MDLSTLNKMHRFTLKLCIMSRRLSVKTVCFLINMKYDLVKCVYFINVYQVYDRTYSHPLYKLERRRISASKHIKNKTQEK